MVGQTVIEAPAAYFGAGERHRGPLLMNELGRPLTYRQWKLLWIAASETAKVVATVTLGGISTPAR